MKIHHFNWFNVRGMSCCLCSSKLWPICCLVKWNCFKCLQYGSHCKFSGICHLMIVRPIKQTVTNYQSRHLCDSFISLQFRSHVLQASVRTLPQKQVIVNSLHLLASCQHNRTTKNASQLNMNARGCNLRRNFLNSRLVNTSVRSNELHIKTELESPSIGLVQGCLVF